MMGSLSLLLAVVRVGLIGCDTSHTLAFAKIINTDRPAYAEGFRVTHAHKWGSKDIVSSTNRYEKYIKELVEERGVAMCDSVDELLERVDVVCLETNDGREHLWQAEKVFRAGKLCFIDKPLAEDYPHAKAIYDLGVRYGAKYFSSSALRFADEQQNCATGRYGRIESVYYASPSPIEEQGTHSRYVWYGIHGFEPIAAIMGTGVESVRSLAGKDADTIFYRFKDGRTAVLRLNLSDWRYCGYATAADQKLPPIALGGYEGYEKELRVILDFFRTGRVPFPNEETLVEFAVMDAAAKSRAENGREVNLSEIMK